MENIEILWNSALSYIEKNINRITYATFIVNLTPVDLEGDNIVLLAHSKQDAVSTKRVADKIVEALRKSDTGLKNFTIFLEKMTTPFFTTVEADDHSAEDTPLNPNFTFDSFVVGESNSFAVAAARAVAEDPGRSYNPLFVYGDSGLGKTHLIQAVANEIKSTHPKLKVMYVTCERFVNDLIQSIRSGKSFQADGSEEFRKRYRSVDVLIVDDVQFLAKKQSTQVEFFHTFNELYDNNKQIILSADCHPSRIETLEDRLVTRFQGGMMAEIIVPTLEMKIAILQKKAEKQKVILKTEVAEFLAEHGGNDVRSLEGLLNKVIFTSLLKEQPITVELAREAINLSKPAANSSETVTTERIISAVCSYYNVQKSDLIGKKKNKELVEPRQICVYLMTELLNIPLVSVGQAVGGRDHTTVIYTRNKVAELIKTSQKTATEVNDLKNLIHKK